MTMEVITNQLLDELILVRLLIGKRPPSKQKLREDVGQLCKSRPNGEAWESALQGLVEEGLLSRQPLRLTETGRARALAFLRLETVPPRLTWPLLKANFLVPLALGLVAPSRKLRDQLKKPAGLSAFMLQQQFELPDQGSLALDKVVQTLACQLICRALDREGGEPTTRFTSLGQLKKKLPILLTGAPSGKMHQLRDAILQRWLASANGESPAPPATSESPDPRTRFLEPPTSEPREVHLDATTFAATVQAAARSSSTGLWGTNKVFINHVWRQLQQEPNFPQLDLVAFKERLLEAHQRGLLRLERADLVEAMNTGDVAESATTFLTATYHFILIERDRP